MIWRIKWVANQDENIILTDRSYFIIPNYGAAFQLEENVVCIENPKRYEFFRKATP